MDIDMLVMNGCEAIQIIRRRMEYLPILAMSMNLELEDKCLEIGADDFLEKSCFPDKLLVKLKEWEDIKILNITFTENQIQINKEMPMNSQQASILKQLKKQKLHIPVHLEHQFRFNSNTNSGTSRTPIPI